MAGLRHRSLPNREWEEKKTEKEKNERLREYIITVMNEATHEEHFAEVSFV